MATNPSEGSCAALRIAANRPRGEQPGDRQLGEEALYPIERLGFGAMHFRSLRYLGGISIPAGVAIISHMSFLPPSSMPMARLLLE